MASNMLSWAYLALVAFTLCTPFEARASTLFGTEFAGLTPLHTLDQTNGSATAVAPATNLLDIGDLTSDTRPGSFTLWGVDLTNNELLTIDPNTGSETNSVAISGTQAAITSLAFDSVSGRLFGNTTVAFGASFDELFEINPLTGAATSIGRILFDNVFALAFDQSGNLFGVADATDELISISTATGNGSSIATLVVGSAFDIASRPEDDTMFLADSGTVGTNTLYTVDTASGALTTVGSFSAAVGLNIAGLAFSPVPEPGTVILVGVSLLPLGLLRLRRRS